MTFLGIFFDSLFLNKGEGGVQFLKKRRFRRKKTKKRNLSFKKVSLIFDSEESILLDTVRSSHSKHLNSCSTKFSTIDILSPGLFDPFSHFW